MKCRVGQTITEVPNRHGSIALPATLMWDFGRSKTGLYGTIYLDVLIWSFSIDVGVGQTDMRPHYHNEIPRHSRWQRLIFWIKERTVWSFIHR